MRIIINNNAVAMVALPLLLAAIMAVVVNANVVGFYVRVEIDPDASTISQPCSAEFKTNLTHQVLGWVSDGAASHLGQPDSSLDGLSFGMTYDADDQVLLDDDTAAAAAANATACDTTNACTQCCRSTTTTDCFAFCTSTNVGARRQRSLLRWGSNSNSHHRRVEEIITTQKDKDVTAWVEFAAQSWLADNDDNACMGNPWNLTVAVNFISP